MENHNTHKELSGELLVIGQDNIEIELKHGKPRDIDVYFKGEGTVVPCDPKHYDELEWKIIGPRPSLWDELCDSMNFHSHSHGHHILSIAWNVSGTRTISWIVTY